MRRFLRLAASLSALALAACGSDSSLPEATGKGTVRAINAIETSPEFVFLIEERGIDSVAYKQATSSVSWDDLNYTFHFDVLFLGEDERRRVASVNLDVVANTDYTFVISGAVAAPTITVWESDLREWGETETATEFRIAHLADSENSVDVYVAAPGVAPVAGEAVGTLAYGEVLPAFERPAGQFVVTVTAAGDENDILFSSNSFTTEAASSLLFSVFDGDANDVAPLSVLSYNTISGGTALLYDSRLSPTIRFFHASKDPAVDLVDIYVEDLLAMPAPAPLVAGHAFEDITGDITVPVGTLPIAYTTADDIMAIHIQEELSPAPSLRWNLYFVGGPGNPQIVLGRADRRSVETVAKLSLLQTAANHEFLDLYIVDRDEDITPETVLPAGIGISLTGLPINTTLLAGSYDLYLTTSGEKTVVDGPFPLDVELGDLVDLIVYDVDDTAFAKIVEIPPVTPLP